MPQAGVFPFNSGHVGLADNLVALRDELRINRIAIRHIEIALPEAHYQPNGLKGFSTVVAQSPGQNAWAEVVNSSP